MPVTSKPTSTRQGPLGKTKELALKKGQNTKIHLAVNSHSLPVRIAVTAGTVADCTQPLSLVAGLKAQVFLADRGYDTDAIVEGKQKEGM